jgi:hypothetical protein
MNRLEAYREANRPLFQQRPRWFRVAVFSGCLLGAWALLRWLPGAPNVRAAFLLLFAWCAFELAFALVALFSRSAWQKWINPTADRRWARRMLWLEVSGSIVSLALLLVMVRMLSVFR